MLYAVPDPPPIDGSWRARLLYRETNKGSEIVDCPANAVTILRNDPAWGGVLAWNEFNQAIVCRRAAPWAQDDAPKVADPKRPWSDTDGVRVQNWLRRTHELTVSSKDAYLAALMVAEANAFDPVIDWFASLEWDEHTRVDSWMSVYLGCAPGPYASFVGRSFLVSSVARALVPGSKVDTMPIWEGPQGLFKSQAARVLYGDEWFSDTPLELSSKDRFVGLRGLLCHEMAELDGMGKADTGRVKSFLSSKIDNYRPPYGQHTVSVPRRVVMLGTMNPTALGYLVDQTGNRRMWPIECGAVGPIDLLGLERDRAQLWAEAREMYGTGPRSGGMLWWPTTPDERRLCNQEQEARMVADVWIGKIEQWLGEANMGSPVTVRRVLTECLSIEAAKQDKGNATRAGMCLAQLGWVADRRARIPGGGQERTYVKPATPEQEAIAQASEREREEAERLRT